MEIKCHSKYIRWIKRFILVAGIIPMIVLTINDLVPLLTDYQDREKNVLTQVSIEMNNSIPRPYVTVCVPYYSNVLDTIKDWSSYRGSDPNVTPPEAFMAMRNHSWNMNVTLFNNSDEGVVEIVKRIITLNEDDQLATLSGKNGFDWNQPIIDAVWRYLFNVILQDRSLTPPYPQDDLPPDIFSMQDGIPSKVGQLSNKQMDQLFVSVLETIFPDYYFYSHQKVPVASVGMMDEGVGFCLQPDTTDTEVMDSDGSMTFLFTFRTYGTTNGLALPVRVFEDPSIMYSSLAGQFQTSETHVAEAEAAAVSTARMALTYSVESRFIENRTDRICSYDLSPALCFANHQVNLTIEHCQCIPFAYRFLRDNPNNLSYCHFVHYEACREKLVESAKKNTYCSRKCEYTFYRWNPVIGSALAPLDGGDVTRMQTWFDLTVKPLQVTPYLEFKLTDKMNLHELFAQLGGSIGLYLGFSCLTGFGVLGLLVEFIIMRYEAKKGMDTAENGANSVWTFLWTKNFLTILASRAEDDKRGKRDDVCNELYELKKETSQLTNLIDHKMTEYEEHDKMRGQKMDEMDKRMEDLSKQFMQQSELMMKMLVQLKNDMETLTQKMQ